jgi:hypothetical protein
MKQWGRAAPMRPCLAEDPRIPAAGRAPAGARSWRLETEGGRVMRQQWAKIVVSVEVELMALERRATKLRELKRLALELD